MEDLHGNYLSIRQAAQTGLIRESTLRGLVKNRLCPGFYVGNRFYVNMDELKRILNAASRKRISIKSYKNAQYIKAKEE